jgi:resuscitation-promoting factor RpfB
VLIERVAWTPKAYARHLLHRRGQDAQWPCLDALWERESHWNPLAHNSSSGAHGIPQSLPGWKMGPGWYSNARVQVRWGLRYLAGRYGGPCGGWAHSQATGWY